MNIKEAFFSALNSIRANKLRADPAWNNYREFSIIGVMTLLDALQKGIDSGLSQLGTSTFQVQKWPVSFVSGPGKWRKYEKRKPITIEEGYRLKEISILPKYVGLEDWSGGKSIKYTLDKLIQISRWPELQPNLGPQIIIRSQTAGFLLKMRSAHRKILQYWGWRLLTSFSHSLPRLERKSK
jgi:hypothetical protein